MQLILTLSAITSRLAALCDELRLSIEAAWEVCYQLLHLFDVCEEKRFASDSLAKLTRHAPCSQLELSGYARFSKNVLK